MEMNDLLEFLRELARNNNKEWFTANKSRYQQLLSLWNQFCEELIHEMGQYDEDIARLTPKDCTWRIYRDTRFSKDKTPYKTHVGVFLAPGGKKSMHAGYYFQVGQDSWGRNMLAAGNYCYDPKALSILREDISDNWEEFRDEIVGVADARFGKMMDDALKRVPKPYKEDAPYADYLRMKSFGLVMEVDDAFIVAPNLAKRVAELFLSTKPLVDYINRAVDFAREEL